MIRNLKLLFNIVALELYDFFNKNVIRKFRKKYAKFKIKYDFDLKSIYYNNQILFNLNLKKFFESNSNRFRNITKKNLKQKAKNCNNKKRKKKIQTRNHNSKKFEK